MNKLVQDNDIQILVKVAQRSALLEKAAKEELWELNKEFNIFLRNQLEANGIDANLILNTPQARDVLVNTLAKSFVYTPSVEAVNRIQAIRDEAYSILPQNIQTEKWKPDTCGCELHSIYEMIGGVPDMESRQTFHTITCKDHEGLTTEEIHHTIRNENTLKNVVHKHLIETFEGELSERKLLENGSQALDWKKEIDYTWEWTGKGKNRVFKPLLKEKMLQVDGKQTLVDKTLTKAQENSLKPFVETTFGVSKMII